MIGRRMMPREDHVDVLMAVYCIAAVIRPRAQITLERVAKIARLRQDRVRFIASDLCLAGYLHPGGYGSEAGGRDVWYLTADGWTVAEPVVKPCAACGRELGHTVTPASLELFPHVEWAPAPHVCQLRWEAICR